MSRRNGSNGVHHEAPPQAEAPPLPAPEPQDEKNVPCFVARYATIRASVWREQTSEGRTFYNVTLSRLYKGADNVWYSTNSFGYRDLPLVEKVSAAAFEWIASQLIDTPF